MTAMPTAPESLKTTTTTVSVIPRLFMYSTVFIGGMTTLAIEMTASRLMGSVFGSSNLIWANVIGLMLLYLTVGYFIGGRWADRSPRYSTFYQIIIWSAFLCALIPLIARPVLTFAADAVVGINAGVVIGSFLAVVALFAIPITLMGTISPFALRLSMTNIQDAGSLAGRLYAISTLGSLVGTFIPVLVTIPLLGTNATFLIFSGLLFVTGIIGYARVASVRKTLPYLALLGIILIITMLLNGRVLRNPLSGATLLYEDESAYNYIQVQEIADGTRYLYLNEGQGIHSEWNPTVFGNGRTWDFFLAAPYFNTAPHTPDDVDSLLIIGLAAGTIARQYTHVYGNIPIDGIEIDPAIVETAARYFDMNASAMPNLSVIVEDGRYGLHQLTRQYSVVAIDAYRPPYIPWHLTTVEFFAEVQAKLSTEGVVAINVGRTPQDRSLVQALTATLLQVFPTVHSIDVPRSFNTILVATQQPTAYAEFVTNFDNLPLETNLLLRQTYEKALLGAVPTVASDVVFTDDRAPVETIVDSLVVNFLLSGGADQLR